MITKAYMGGKEVVFYREKDLFLPAKKDTNRYYIKLHTHIDKDENLIIKVRNISRRLKYRIARGERFNLVAAIRCASRPMNFKTSKKNDMVASGQHIIRQIIHFERDMGYVEIHVESPNGVLICGHINLYWGD